MAVRLNAPLPPNATIGIIGGGQLGRMLASAAARLGFRSIILEPGAVCPAAQVANHHIQAAYDDADALADLAARCDVVTYEFENVPLVAAEQLAPLVPLYPPARALEVSQDRLVEKTTLWEAGIAVADFLPVETQADLDQALAAFNGGVLKTRRFGYDGKGQRVFKPGESPQADALDDVGSGPFILEKLIAFDAEFSVIAARAADGTVIAYDPSLNVHEGGILRMSTVPSGLSAALVDEAKRVAMRLLETLDYVGVIGVEFFAFGDTLLVNEFAPRVHNSGHWTREACICGQFEQHIRAVTGHGLGSVARHSDAVMENLLGDAGIDIARLLEDGDAIVTLYGKAEAREGRKMGHVTRLKPLS